MQILLIFALLMMAAVVCDGSCFPAIFAFGDDWADLGNGGALYPGEAAKLADTPPYGSTFFKHPAHRLCDGRLILDFLAEAMEIPLLPPYVGIAPSLKHGVSFAVAGSTSGAYTYKVPYSLDVQVQWAQKFHADVVDARGSGVQQDLPDPNTTFSNALYVVYTGQNDYRYALLYGHMDVHQVLESLVPVVVANITNHVMNLNTTFHGVKIMVIGVPPLGCTPEILTAFPSYNGKDYDDRGCLKAYNAISALHNVLLRRALGFAKGVAFVDMYLILNDTMYTPSRSNFMEEDRLQACCGAAGKAYHYHPDVMCGTKQLNGNWTSCDRPSGYLSWDGIHATEALNRVVATSILKQKYTFPSNTFTCFDNLTIPFNNK